jgi:hypothetical protein
MIYKNFFFFLHIVHIQYLYPINANNFFFINIHNNYFLIYIMNIIKSSTINFFIEDNLRNYNYMGLFILLTNKYYHVYQDIEMFFDILV